MYGEKFARVQYNFLSTTILRWIAEPGLIAFSFYRFELDRALAIFLLITLMVLLANQIMNRIALEFGEAERRRWHGELTLRLAFECWVDRVRGGIHIDVPEIFQEASKRATEDIQSADKDYQIAKKYGFALKHSVMKTVVLDIISISILYGAAIYAGIFLRGFMK